MVQTIAVSEAAFVESMTSLLLEDADSINTVTNWWHPRIKVLEKWLRDDGNKASLPDDGTEEMIRKCIQRGDIYTQSQLKCWKHIVLELSEVPSLMMAAQSVDDSEGMAQTSPSRGKLRPGKELIILSDEINQETPGDTGPVMSDDDNAANLGQLAMIAVASSSGNTKKIGGLSMMERQAEWLRKKQEKLALEKQRQEEEKGKELTFQPKLIRRATFNSDRPAGIDERAPVVTTVRTVVARTSEPASTAPTSTAITTVSTETRRPPSGNINSRKGSAKGTKKKKYIPVTQTLEVQSSLLDSMRSELEASMQRTAPLSPRPFDSSNNAEPDSTIDTEPSPPATEADPVQEQPPAELKSWSDRPVIGNFRVEFDSTDTKARLILQDASKFELSSMYRKTDRKAQRDGVALHMGRREDTYDEEVIAILFDKERVSEPDAAKWWKDHEHRFSQYIRDRSSTASQSALASAVASLTSS